MIKKTIILVLVILLVVNTIYWLYIGIRVYRVVSLDKSFEVLEQGKTLTRMNEEDSKKLIRKYFEKRDKLTHGFGGYFVGIFDDTFPHTPFIILPITDAVLIAISFMIILLYKKE